MKLFVTAALLAFLGYASADCGCLKCSKHLTIIGKIAPNANCPPTTVICRGPRDQYAGKSLPIKVQTPEVTVTTETPKTTRHLKYKVVEYTPCCCIGCSGAKYDAKIETPSTTAAPAVTVTKVDLKPCVDRLVIPAPHGGCGRRISSTKDCEWAPTSSYTVGEPVYVDPIRGCEKVFVNPLRDPTIYVDPYRGCSPIIRTRVRGCSGPALDCSLIKKFTSRYTDRISPSLNSRIRDCGESIQPIKNRSKREVPFLKHGYKFVVNMLPDFIKEPIKDTVNNLALTHPDRRLQQMYNQPQRLTLKEKLEMQRKKNLALLRNRIRNHAIHNKQYDDDFSFDRGSRRTRTTSYDPTSQLEYTRLKQVSPRSKFESSNLPRHFQNYLDENESETFNWYPYFKHEVLDKELKKSLLMKQLDKLSEKQNRVKRSEAYEKYLLKRFKKSPGRKRRPNILEASEIVLPFYHVKEHSGEDQRKYNYDDPWDLHSKPTSRGETAKYRMSNDNNPWDGYLKSPSPGSYRSRRGSEQNDFLDPISFKHVVAENHKLKEAFLRNVIRDELKSFRVQNEEDPQNILQSTKNHIPQLPHQMPHSSLFNVMTLPINLLNNLNEIAKEAFPVLGSLPKVVTGTKKYFRDFGKNFKKNFLHLTSDLIGDFDNMNVHKHIFVPGRHRRSFDQTTLEDKVRRKRYILKEVDEDEIEDYILEKLGSIFEDSEYTNTRRYPKEDTSPFWMKHSTPHYEEDREKKFMLQHVKPKIILDNKGKPFLEVNGYKRPLWRKPMINNMQKLKSTKRPSTKFRFHDISEEADREKIASLIDHAKNHMETNLGASHSEMPIKTIKERISQLLYETDTLVHIDFDKYDGIYDDLIALQHTKRAIVQDWKRLILSKAINDIGAKTALIERFEELQHYKDLTLINIVTTLYEEHENMFVTKKLIKMLVRLQKLQCIINQVVTNFQHHLHISSKSEIAKEIEYVDMLDGLNFALDTSRNNMINNLVKDRDTALQRNISILDKLKKLLESNGDGNKVEKEADLLWEMNNIEKMQRNTIDDMKHKLDAGYKVKNELKILFDLLKRYEGCERDQKKLMTKFGRESSEEEQEESSEVLGKSKYKKSMSKKKYDLDELKFKIDEVLKKQRELLRKQLKKNKRQMKKKYEDSDEYD